MVNKNSSEAYNKGFKSECYDNPYTVGSDEYNDGWVTMIGLDKTQYGTHTMRRTKPSLIYKKTKNLRACQLLLGHRKLESTVSYLGIEVDDALEISENIDS
jgi:hypothetical protein